MFVLIASVLSRVAHGKNCERQKKSIIHYGSACKKQVRGRDGALREFDIPLVLHVDIVYVLWQWMSIIAPLNARNAVCQNVCSV